MTTQIQLTDEQFEIILDALAQFPMRAKDEKYAKLASETYDELIAQSPLNSKGQAR